MREIKFRAWDKEESKMWNKNHPVICGGTPMLFCGARYNVGKEEVTVYHFYEKPSLILMQYTGLKDKNGVEIYEGDVVNIIAKTASSKSKDSKRIGKIFFDDGMGWPCFRAVVWNKKGKTWDYPQSVNLSTIEVIGNIYENSDLIGDEKN